MIIWDHGSSTIYTSLGLITWRHHLEISRDQQKFIKKPGYMVERRLWTKNPQQIATFDFLNFMKNSNLGTSWSVICGQKIQSYWCGFFVHKWRSTIKGFFVHNLQIGVKGISVIKKSKTWNQISSQGHLDVSYPNLTRHFS